MISQLGEQIESSSSWLSLTSVLSTFEGAIPAQQLAFSHCEFSQIMDNFDLLRSHTTLISCQGYKWL